MYNLMSLAILLENTTEGATESASSGWLKTAMSIVPFILIILLFWLILIRPQKKKEKEEQKMRNSIMPGDTVITIGGIVGVVRSIKEDAEQYVIETGADKNKMTIKKWAIQSVEKKSTDTMYSTDAE